MAVYLKIEIVNDSFDLSNNHSGSYTPKKMIIAKQFGGINHPLGDSPHQYQRTISNQTPCFKLASIKPSKSPSNTALVLPTSYPVRKSLMRDESST